MVLIYDAFFTEVDKYSKILQNAKKADGIVKEKIGTHREGIEMLCMPADRLKSTIPSASKVAAIRDNPVSIEGVLITWDVLKSVIYKSEVFLRLLDSYHLEI